MWGDLLTEAFGNYVSQHTYIHIYICMSVCIVNSHA